MFLTIGKVFQIENRHKMNALGEGGNRRYGSGKNLARLDSQRFQAIRSPEASRSSFNW